MLSGVVLSVTAIGAVAAQSHDLGFGSSPSRSIPADIDLHERLGDGLGYGDHSYVFEVVSANELDEMRNELAQIFAMDSGFADLVEMQVQPSECEPVFSQVTNPDLTPTGASEVAVSEFQPYVGGSEFGEGTSGVIIVARDAPRPDLTQDAALVETCADMTVTMAMELFGEGFEVNSVIHLEPMPFDLGGDNQAGYMMTTMIGNMDELLGFSSETEFGDDSDVDLTYQATTLAAATLSIDDFVITGILVIPPGSQVISNPHQLLDYLDETVTRLETPLDELTAGFYPPFGH
ncbi:MAG: hypothetical protein Q4Q03_03510 [Bowdeniella nasicola]|nr:hypothetical protein [Bowdeniella nasicola]